MILSQSKDWIVALEEKNNAQQGELQSAIETLKSIIGRMKNDGIKDDVEKISNLF